VDRVAGLDVVANINILFCWESNLGLPTRSLINILTGLPGLQVNTLKRESLLKYNFNFHFKTNTRRLHYKAQMFSAFYGNNSVYLRIIWKPETTSVERTQVY
jgi:hypothetical protein